MCSCGRSVALGPRAPMAAAGTAPAPPRAHTRPRHPAGAGSVWPVCPCALRRARSGGGQPRRHLQRRHEAPPVRGPELYRGSQDCVFGYEKRAPSAPLPCRGASTARNATARPAGAPRSLARVDEPTTGMDPYIRRDVWNLILRLKKGRSIIMTTHVRDRLGRSGLRGSARARMKPGQGRHVAPSFRRAHAGPPPGTSRWRRPMCSATKSW